jgi:hypothetical protein
MRQAYVILARAWLVVLLAVSLDSPLAAQETASGEVKVSVELILMADGSGSIDDPEFDLQRGGYAKALRHPSVLEAIRGGFLGQIALSYVEWSGPYLQVPIVPWTLIRNKNDLEEFAFLLEHKPRELYGGGTAPGNAILHGAESLLTNAFNGRRKVIDISGDGPDRNGIPSAFGRDQAVAQGITINGLPILLDFPGLDIFFRENVIGGRGAFVIAATGFDDFYDAVRKKLILEIAGDPSDEAPQTAERPQPRKAD